MTKPRRHVAGQIALLTRRCLEQRHYLRPDDYMHQVVGFEIGKVADQFGQQLYAAMAMSNHLHFGVGDTTGNRSDFMGHAMAGIARARNRDLGRKGRFWETCPFGDTVLLDANAIERKLVYIWLNPVRAGLVERAEDWPGFAILPTDWGETMRFGKPERYYGWRSPDVVEITPEPPPIANHLTLEEARNHYQNLLRIAEDEVASIRRDQGLDFLGVEKISDVAPLDRPKGQDDSKKINPRFATTDPQLMNRAIENYQSFVDRYQRCRRRWLQNDPVTLPSGTVALRRNTPLETEEPSSDEPGLLASPNDSLNTD